VRKSLYIFIIVALLAGAGTVVVQRAAADTPNVVIIVNESQNISSITRGDLAKLFLKKKTKWDNGNKVAPVDQSEDSAVRDLFSEAFLGKKASAISSYWQQQIFAGRSVPPEVKGSDLDVINYVKANAYAIGYVSKDVAITGVKIVEVVD
jgi:ABC-type phosphate transport system substrate-binding protein